MQGIVGFFPTVNNMEMLKIAISQTVCADANQGDRRMPPRGVLRSQRRGKRGGAQGRRPGLADWGLPHPEPEDAAALREGGAAAAGRREPPVTEPRLARHVGARRCGHWPEARVHETGPRRHSRGLC